MESLRGEAYPVFRTLGTLTLEEIEVAFLEPGVGSQQKLVRKQQAPSISMLFVFLSRVTSPMLPTCDL